MLVEDINQQNTKGEIQIANRYLKCFSTLLTIKETQSKGIYKFSPIKLQGLYNKVHRADKEKETWVLST